MITRISTPGRPGPRARAIAYRLAEPVAQRRVAALGQGPVLVQDLRLALALQRQPEPHDRIIGPLGDLDLLQRHGDRFAVVRQVGPASLNRSWFGCSVISAIGWLAKVSPGSAMGASMARARVAACRRAWPIVAASFSIRTWTGGGARRRSSRYRSGRSRHRDSPSRPADHIPRRRSGGHRR